MQFAMHCFSSPSKSESFDHIVIAGKPRLISSRRSFPRTSSDELPQPLPLPESQLLLPREPKLLSSGSHPLPSPGRPHSVGDTEIERGRRRGLDDQLRRLVGKNTQRSVERSEFQLYRKSPAKRYAGCSSKIVAPKSAPTSPYSSPVSSPQCSYFSTSNYTTPAGACSAPLMPHSNGNTRLSCNLQMPSDKIALLVDDSPHTSPTVSSSIHVPSKISFETPVMRRESNAEANVHTLPLPPRTDMSSLPTPVSSNFATSDLSGATMSLPPTLISTLAARPEPPEVKKASAISQVVLKPEEVPMRSQWQKGKLIGRGTFGSVYVASNKETGALCAMKEVEIFPEDIKSQESMRQLEQEIKVLSNLKHPNIVQYYGSEIVGDKFYIYLEYVHPGSINKFIHDHCAAITESVVRNFTRHILCGLAYLHSTKTIHRDIKCANLLVDAYGVVKLTDFGMSKHLNGEVANLSLKGSPYWLAPELLQSVVPKDASADLALAVDIWSLGCTIIEMINGKPPWSDCEGAAALFKVLKETPPIPETLSAEGKDFLQLCFCRNPSDRPTAFKLLDHPFVDIPSLKEKDSMQFQRAHPCHKSNQILASFDQKIKKGKLAIK